MLGESHELTGIGELGLDLQNRKCKIKTLGTKQRAEGRSGGVHYLLVGGEGLLNGGKVAAEGLDAVVDEDDNIELAVQDV